ncbi:hypothetical protein MKL26_05810 [Streptococcus suis]|nr:hypothetical protein [Streptococcus suis]
MQMTAYEAVELLQLEPGSDERAIKRAFAFLSKYTHPEEHPEAYKYLYEAYQLALDLQKKGYLEAIIQQVQAEKDRMKTDDTDDLFDLQIPSQEQASSQVTEPTQPSHSEVNSGTYPSFNFTNLNVDESIPLVEEETQQDKSEFQFEENESVEEQTQESDPEFRFDEVEQVEVDPYQRKIELAPEDIQAAKPAKKIRFAWGTKSIFLLINTIGIIVSNNFEAPISHRLLAIFVVMISTFIGLGVYMTLRRKHMGPSALFLTSLILFVASFIAVMITLDQPGILVLINTIFTFLNVAAFLLMFIGIFWWIFGFLKRIFKKK